MNDNNQDAGNPVTIEEAVEQVKKWADAKDYEKVKEGCEEILEAEPDHEELKELLETANKNLQTDGQQEPKTEAYEVSAQNEAQLQDTLTAKPAEGASGGTIPVESAEKGGGEEKSETPEPEPKPEKPELGPIEPEIKLEKPAPEPKIEPLPEPKVESKEEEDSPADIFSKPAEKTAEPPKSTTEKPKKTEEKPKVESKSKGKPAKSKSVETPKKKKNNSKLLIIVVGVLILAAFGISAFMGFLNPVFEAILSLLGL